MPSRNFWKSSVCIACFLRLRMDRTKSFSPHLGRQPSFCRRAIGRLQLLLPVRHAPLVQDQTPPFLPLALHDAHDIGKTRFAPGSRDSRGMAEFLLRGARAQEPEESRVARITVPYSELAQVAAAGFRLSRRDPVLPFLVSGQPLHPHLVVSGKSRSIYFRPAACRRTLRRQGIPGERIKLPPGFHVSRLKPHA